MQRQTPSAGQAGVVRGSPGPQRAAGGPESSGLLWKRTAGQGWLELQSVRRKLPQRKRGAKGPGMASSCKCLRALLRANAPHLVRGTNRPGRSLIPGPRRPLATGSTGRVAEKSLRTQVGQELPGSPLQMPGCTASLSPAPCASLPAVCPCPTSSRTAGAAAPPPPSAGGWRQRLERGKKKCPRRGQGAVPPTQKMKQQN